VANVESKNFDQPDVTKELPKTRIDLVGLAGGQVQRSTLEPGWRWTGSVGPAVNADRCPDNHIAYVAAESLHAEHDDGSEGEFAAGEVFHLAPGHDAWVVGDEPVVLIELQGLLHRDH
jgi:hypothetical protein